MSDIDNFDDFSNDIGLGDEDKDKIKSNRIDWYKGEKGRTDRVAIVYFNRHDVKQILNAKRKGSVTPEQAKELAEKVKGLLATKLSKSVAELTDVDMLDTSEIRMKTYSLHFQEGVGAVLSGLGKGDAEADKVWSKLAPPKTTVTTLLLQYRTDKEGDIDKEHLLRAAKGEGYGTSWKLIPWKFTGDEKYNRIRKLNKGLQENGLSIAGQDLSITCQETKFQKMDINLAGPALWQKSEKFKHVVLAKALEMYDNLAPGREMSTEELRIKLGLGGGTSLGTDVSSDDFSKLLDQV